MTFIRKDCRFFLGSRPCVPNKMSGQECGSCEVFETRTERFLIIKLDAPGDVLRTTSLLPALKERHPTAGIVWVTRDKSAGLFASNPWVDAVWPYGLETLTQLQVQSWERVYNLSNDEPSSALAALAAGERKIGFTMDARGTIVPSNDHAKRWMSLAVFDREKKSNTRSFQEMMYDICELPKPIHNPCIFPDASTLAWGRRFVEEHFGQRDPGAPVLGINTGCGSRWPRKMLDTDRIVTLIQEILSDSLGWNVLLLGGPKEKEKNPAIAARVKPGRVADAGTHHSMLAFSSLLAACDVVLCGDTLALHMACALSVPTVALFGPTSIAEIYDYQGLVRKLHPRNLECLCCYSHCDRPDHCMASIPLAEILQGIREQYARWSQNRS